MSRFTSQSAFRARPRDASAQPVLTDPGSIGGEGGAVAGAVSGFAGEVSKVALKFAQAGAAMRAKGASAGSRRSKVNNSNRLRAEVINERTRIENSDVPIENKDEEFAKNIPAIISGFDPDTQNTNAAWTAGQFRGYADFSGKVHDQLAIQDVEMSNSFIDENSNIDQVFRDIESMGLGEVNEREYKLDAEERYQESKLAALVGVASGIQTPDGLDVVEEQMMGFLKFVDEAQAREDIFGNVATAESYDGDNEDRMEMFLSKIGDPEFKAKTRSRFRSKDSEIKGGDRIAELVGQGLPVTGSSADLKAYDNLLARNLTRSEITKFKVENGVPITDVDQNALSSLFDPDKGFNLDQGARSLMELPPEQAFRMAKSLDNSHFAEAVYFDVSSLDKNDVRNFDALLAQKLAKFNHPDAQEALEKANDKIFGSKEATFTVGKVTTEKKDVPPFTFDEYGQMLHTDDPSIVTPDILSATRNAVRVLMIQNRTESGATAELEKLITKSTDGVAGYLRDNGKLGRIIQTRVGKREFLSDVAETLTFGVAKLGKKRSRSISPRLGANSDDIVEQLQGEVLMMSVELQPLGSSNLIAFRPSAAEGRVDIPVIDAEGDKFDRYVPMMLDDEVVAYMKFVPELSKKMSVFGTRVITPPKLVKRGDNEFERLSRLHVEQVSPESFNPNSHLQRPPGVQDKSEVGYSPKGTIKNSFDDITDEMYFKRFGVMPDDATPDQEALGAKRWSAIREQVSKGGNYESIFPLEALTNDTGSE